jgi:hypothetical protein
VKTALLYNFIGLKGRLFSRLNEAQLHSLLEEHKLVDWTFEKGLSVNPLPRIVETLWRGKFIYDLYPPKEFSQFNGEEFCYADTAYLRYRKSKAEKDLNDFIAILYRPLDPKKKHGDRRLAFDPDAVDTYLIAAKSLPLHKKVAVTLWYEHKREEFFKPFAPLFKKGAQEKASSEGSYLELLLELAGGKFGTLQETKRTGVHTLFSEILLQKKKAARREKQLEEIRDKKQRA